MNTTTTQHRSFKPGEIWPDTNGIHINSHGGGILLDQGTYYWFASTRSKAKRERREVGVSCYSSTISTTGRNRGIVLPVVKDARHDSRLDASSSGRRWIHNRKTGKIRNVVSPGTQATAYNSARCGVAIADRPTGPYAYREELPAHRARCRANDIVRR
jgi:hypothetical protein